MGLFKNEAISKNSPFRTGPLKGLPEVEESVFDWVSWYNNERLHSFLGNVPPEEYERTTTLKLSAHQRVKPPTNRRHKNRDGSYLASSVWLGASSSKSAVGVLR